MSEKTCKTCRWSIGGPNGLTCQLGKSTIRICPRYEREPGSDDE